MRCACAGLGQRSRRGRRCLVWPSGDSRPSGCRQLVVLCRSQACTSPYAVVAGAGLTGRMFSRRRCRWERAIRAGLPEDVEPFTELRDTRKLNDPEKRRVEQARSTRDRTTDPDR